MTGDDKQIVGDVIGDVFDRLRGATFPVSKQPTEAELLELIEEIAVNRQQHLKPRRKS